MRTLDYASEQSHDIEADNPYAASDKTVRSARVVSQLLARMSEGK